MFDLRAIAPHLLCIIFIDPHLQSPLVCFDQFILFDGNDRVGGGGGTRKVTPSLGILELQPLLACCEKGSVNVMTGVRYEPPSSVSVQKWIVVLWASPGDLLAMIQL